MKFLKKQKPSSIYGTSPQYNTKQKVLGASAGLIILLFIIFSLFGGRSSSPSISTSGSKKSPDTKELKLNQSKHTLGVSNFAISVPEGFNQNKDTDFLKNNRGEVLFRKSASGLKYDFISVAKQSSDPKDDSLQVIENQLKTFATDDLKTNITKLNDGRNILIAEHSSYFDRRQIQSSDSNSDDSINYSVEYYIVEVNSIWQISFSSITKDSLYLKSSLQVVESFKLI
jgi:hypothetical protein